MQPANLLALGASCPGHGHLLNSATALPVESPLTLTLASHSHLSPVPTLLATPAPLLCSQTQLTLLLKKCENPADGRSAEHQHPAPRSHGTSNAIICQNLFPLTSDCEPPGAGGLGLFSGLQSSHQLLYS